MTIKYWQKKETLRAWIYRLLADIEEADEVSGGLTYNGDKTIIEVETKKKEDAEEIPF